MRTRMIGVWALGAVMVLGGVACKNPKIGETRGRTVKASIADFDPSADIVLELDKYGTERPDDYEVQMAFNQSFAPLDECVATAKGRLGVGADATLEGELSVAVKLDPAIGVKPAAVNATLPPRYSTDADLRECVREAVAGVTFPKYDGPPIVAEFACELDAGSEWEDE